MSRRTVYGYKDPNLKQKPKDIVKTVDKSGESGKIKEKDGGRRSKPPSESIHKTTDNSIGSDLFSSESKKKLYENERIISGNKYETSYQLCT